MAESHLTLFGISAKEIARICRVSLKTAQRWKSGQTVPPKSALMILQRDLGCLDSHWGGWQLRGGKLYSPEGWEFSPGDILATQLERRALESARAEVRRLRSELYAGEQPLPDSWPAHKLNIA